MTATAHGITIVGLGPGDPDLRTLGTQRALDEADAIILRTRIHPGLDDLAADPRVSDCDDLYQSSNQFGDLYGAIANRVIDHAKSDANVVFAVPGHPRFAERSVALIVERAAAQRIPVRVLDAVSFVDVAAGAAHADPIEHGLQIVDAEQLAALLDAAPFAAGSLRIDPTRPLLVAQVYDRERATAVKLALSRIYPERHPVTILAAAGIPGNGGPATVALHELDRQHPDHLTSLWVESVLPLEAVRSPETLARIVALLRAPAGCPWDREQTHASLRNAILEEAYETVEAIDEEDLGELAEELGDLLLLVLMHAQIAEESGDFQIEDVYEAINRKLIRRHPHVFATAQADTPDAVVTTWEGVKAQERAQKGKPPANNDRFSRLPKSMPATRKVIEILAPRATLGPASDDRLGDPLLDAITALIAQGIDPEQALEASLRRRAAASTERDTTGTRA